MKMPHSAEGGDRSARVRLGALVLAGTLGLLTACGGASNSSSAGGQGTGAVSTKEDFIEALADMEPITLRTQTLTAVDSLNAAAMVAYQDVITEWSGGKITFDQYGTGALAATDTPGALGQGVFDLGKVYPSFDPAGYPNLSMVANYTPINKNTPINGRLSLMAGWIEASFDTAGFEDLTSKGIVPLEPSVSPGNGMLACNTDEPPVSVDDYKGLRVAVNNAGTSRQVEALGGTPVNVPNAESYESLQRGVVDCVASSMATVGDQKFADVTTYWVITPDAPFAGGQETFAISKMVWDELPLAAQQLFWDKMDVFLETELENNIFQYSIDALEQAAEQDVEVVALDDEASQVLTDLLDGLIEDPSTVTDLPDAKATVDTYVADVNEWYDAVGDLGYEDTTWPEYLDWLEDNPVDVGPFVDALIEKVYTPRRPS